MRKWRPLTSRNFSCLELEGGYVSHLSEHCPYPTTDPYTPPSQERTVTPAQAGRHFSSTLTWMRL